MDAGIKMQSFYDTRSWADIRACCQDFLVYMCNVWFIQLHSFPDLCQHFVRISVTVSVTSVKF